MHAPIAPYTTGRCGRHEHEQPEDCSLAFCVGVFGCVCVGAIKTKSNKKEMSGWRYSMALV